MSVDSSPFYTNIESEFKRILEICNSPNDVKSHFKDLKSIHNAIDQMINQYNNSSITRVKDEVLNLVLNDSIKFTKSYTNDIKHHTVSRLYKLKPVPTVKYSIEMYEDSIYDTLLSYVDPSLDPHTKSGKKTIKNYYKTLNDIKDMIDEVKSNVNFYEQYIVNYRDDLYKNLTNTANVLYNAHLSYLREVLNKSSNENLIKVSLGDNLITVNGKQTKFIESTLHSLLEDHST